MPTKLADIVGQSVFLALCVLLLVFAYNETIFKEKPWLLYVFSFVVAIGIEVCFVCLFTLVVCATTVQLCRGLTGRSEEFGRKGSKSCGLKVERKVWPFEVP